MKAKERMKIYINSGIEWRGWLEEYHQTEQSVWVICNTKKSDRPAAGWSELVDVALCFGWIDSTRKTIDKDSFMQLFSKRKKNSTWSKINKDKVQKLMDAELMTPAGYESITIAKENGSWEILDTVEELMIPGDLDEAFENYKGAREYFSGLSKSLKKMLLAWVVLAKRMETRAKRIEEIAKEASQKRRPKQFR